MADFRSKKIIKSIVFVFTENSFKRAKAVNGIC